MKQNRSIRSAWGSSLLLAGLVALNSGAATFTWDGGAGDGVWGGAVSESNWDTGSYQPGNTARHNYVFTSAAYSGVNSITLGGTNNPNVGNLTFNANTPSLTITVSDAGTGTGRLDLDPALAGAETVTVTAGTHLIAGVSGGEVNLQNLDSQTWHIGSGATLTVSTIISGSSATRGFTKTGEGTLILSGANSYAGGTTLSAGTLQLGANDVFHNSGAVVFNGGKLDSNSHSDTFGALSLTANSTLDLGTPGGGSILIFASASSSAGVVLTIGNWEGSLSGGGTDQVIIGTGAGSVDGNFLGNVQFTGFGLGATFVGNELVPVTPVPEPIMLAMPAFGMLFACFRMGRWYWHRQRRN